MNKSLCKIAISLIVLAGAAEMTDCSFEAMASQTTSSVPESNYSRKTYRPQGKRTIRSIGYVGDFSDIACHTWLTPDDVYYCSPTELRILRNIIYARHGRKFKDAQLRKYFNQFSWYRPYRNEVPMSELSETEKHNIMLIKQFEY